MLTMKFYLIYLSVVLDLYSLKLFFQRKCKLFDSTYDKSYYRFVPISKILNESDYILKYGHNSDLISKLHKARLEYNQMHDEQLVLRSDFKDLYDNRQGNYIDGTKIETKIHELHSKQLVNKYNGKRYVIDTVNTCFFYGNYITIGMREEGSKSHKHITWDILTCREPEFVNYSIENLAKYKVVEKTFIE